MRKTIIFILLAVSNIAIAQTRLAPLSQSVQEIWGKDVFPSYLNEDVECQMIVSPSFVPPFALYIGSRQSSKDMYRLAVKDQEKVIHEMNSDSLTVGRLRRLIKHAVNTSSYTSEFRGCDGVRYFFFDGFKGASVWSPEKKSNTAILVNTMSDVMTAVKNKSQEELDSLMPRIDSLTHVFKTLYPEDFFDNISFGIGYAGGAKPNTYYVLLDVIRKYLFEVKIVIPRSWYKEKDNVKAYKLAEKYASIMKNVGRYIFTETTLLEGGYIQIEVDDKQPRCIENGKKFTLHEEDLTEEKLKKIITTRTLP